MKSVAIEQTSLETCVRDAQQERIILTRGGAPVALILGLEGLDEEQVELGGSEAFWTLIAERRRQPTMSREELERSIRD